MNRENKRKTFEKGYYKTHACRDTFTCKVCGRLCTPENAGSDHRNHCPNCLSSLHVDIGRSRKRLRRHHGARGRLGAKRRRVGDHPPLQALRSAQFESRGGGRQPDEAHEHRHAAAQRAAVPPRAHRGDDRPHGRRGKRAISPKGNRGGGLPMQAASSAA